MQPKRKDRVTGRPKAPEQRKKIRSERFRYPVNRRLGDQPQVQKIKNVRRPGQR